MVSSGSEADRGNPGTWPQPRDGFRAGRGVPRSPSTLAQPHRNWMVKWYAALASLFLENWLGVYIAQLYQVQDLLIFLLTWKRSLLTDSRLISFRISMSRSIFVSTYQYEQDPTEWPLPPPSPELFPADQEALCSCRTLEFTEKKKKLFFYLPIFFLSFWHGLCERNGGFS